MLVNNSTSKGAEVGREQSAACLQGHVVHLLARYTARGVHCCSQPLMARADLACILDCNQAACRTLCVYLRCHWSGQAQLRTFMLRMPAAAMQWQRRHERLKIIAPTSQDLNRSKYALVSAHDLSLSLLKFKASGSTLNTIIQALLRDVYATKPYTNMTIVT